MDREEAEREAEREAARDKACFLHALSCQPAKCPVACIQHLEAEEEHSTSCKHYKNSELVVNSKPKAPFCELSTKPFRPDAFMQRWSTKLIPGYSQKKSFADCISKAFWLRDYKEDKYEYHAIGTTTLFMCERAIMMEGRNGMHDWYHDPDGNNVRDPPPEEDCDAYARVFLPSVNLHNAIKAFHQEGKKDSLRKQIGAYLLERWKNETQGLLPSKKKKNVIHKNPYYDLWSWSCFDLHWAGPWPNTAHTKVSHHILPVFYHHFGCIVPSYHALWVIAKLAQPAKPSKEDVKPILDIGSGTGYWTYMLRNLQLDDSMKKLDVIAVDNQTSTYRTMWIGDTIEMKGTAFLSQHWHEDRFPIEHGKHCVLLLVYPQAKGDFTSSTIKAYQGDTIVVAGTQNENRFTAFDDCMVDEWMSRQMPQFELTLRMPLPSFAGKDEALFVFQRKKGVGDKMESLTLV